MLMGTLGEVAPDSCSPLQPGDSNASCSGAALPPEERRFRSLFNAIPGAAYAWQRVNEDFVLIDYNERAHQVTEGKIREIVGKRASDLYADEPQILSDFVHCFQQRTTIRQEITYRLRSIPKAGVYVVTYAYVPDDMVLVYAEDITELRQAEAALRESQERFEKAFRYHPTAMEIFDLITGQRIDINKSYSDVMGILWQGENGPADEPNAGWADPTQRQQARARLLAQRSVRDFPAQFMTTNGEIRDFSVNATMLDIKDGNLVIASYVDVTERNLAEAARRQLSQAIEQTPVSVVITDRDGAILYVNPKFCEVTGYTLQEALGQNPRILRSGAHTKQFYQHMWDTILSGQVWRGELRNRKKNGELYWEMASIAGVKDENGVITNFVAVKEDITERRRIEEEQTRQERLAAVGHLAAGIAHDFNNILGVITIYAQMFSRSQELPERYRERAGIIHQQATHASHLIQQILDFSRRSTMERQPLSLLPILKEQVKLLSRTLPEHIELHFDYTEDECMLNADPTRIQQVLTNLAVNARDAMPNGGVLSIDLARVHYATRDSVPVVGMTPGEWIVLSVADTGVGMSAEVMEHIFEPFFTTKERGRGTGLGLAQVYGIVKQHDGFIDVTSQVDIGSTFSLYFPPLVQHLSSSAAQGAIGDIPQGSGEHILLVEDDNSVRQVIGELLASWNYEVSQAANGLEAIALLADESRPYKLVISDVIMPKMGGVDLIEFIRITRPTLPVLLITGHFNAAELSRIEALGITTWLPKPLDVPLLAQRIAELVKGDW